MKQRCATARVGWLGILVVLGGAPFMEGFQAGKAPSAQDPLGEFSRSIRALTQRVSPAVVQVLVSSYAASSEEEGGQVSLLSLQRSTGSGVIVDPDGYIMTNAHVVRGAVSVRVLLTPLEGSGRTSSSADRGAPVEASIVGVDRETDLALIKLDRTGLPSLPFGDSDALRQGDIVLAIGSPLGLKNSVSMGVVSAPARQMREDDPLTYIQTDASINPGNSGGALVDVEGKLMGINSFILTQSGGSEGVGFAIPSNMVQSVYQQLRKRGHVHRGRIGVAVQDITPVLAAGLGLPRQDGVIVADVEPEGPADVAGLKQGDVVVLLEGRPVDDARDFEMAFYRRQKGDKATVGILRDGQQIALNVSVDEEQDDDDFLVGMVTPAKNLITRLGILCIEVDENIAKRLPDLRQPAGVIVAAKSNEGQGQYIGLQQGDVIHALDNTPIVSLETFRSTVNALKPGAPVVLLIERDAGFRYIAFEIE